MIQFPFCFIDKRSSKLMKAIKLPFLNYPGIHRNRPHKGQRLVAKRFQSLLHSEVHPSEISISHRFCDRVQDAYTLRCCPQVWTRALYNNSSNAYGPPYYNIDLQRRLDTIRIDTIHCHTKNISKQQQQQQNRYILRWLKTKQVCIIVVEKFIVVGKFERIYHIIMSHKWAI